ncbi:hypothetical protein MBLNU13_g06069t1 [Cladosporium sp. NU13]
MPWNRGDRIDDARARYNISKCNSSVQHPSLEGAHGDRTTQEAIVTGCKTLKSLTIASSDINDVDILVELLRDNYKKSFESLMFYNSDSSFRLHGYQRSVFETDVLSRMPNLRMLYIDSMDVIQDADLEYRDEVRRGLWANGQSWSCLDDIEFFVEYFMSNAIPNSVEVLVLGTQGRSPLSEDEADFFDRAMAMLIENGVANCLAERRRTYRCGKHPPSKFSRGSLPNPIKAVYLVSMDDVDRPPARRKRWFSKAIAAGRKHGVDVHTRTTRGRAFHQIEFLKPLLMASDESTRSSANSLLVFNVYTGNWGPPSCGKCGRCEACLEQYDASVWKEIEGEYGDEMSS